MIGRTLILIATLFSLSAFADYEIEVRTAFTCSVNPQGVLLPTERFDNKPDSVQRTIELVEETGQYVTHRCYFTDRYHYVEPTPEPPVSGPDFSNCLLAEGGQYRCSPENRQVDHTGYTETRVERGWIYTPTEPAPPVDPVPPPVEPPVIPDPPSGWYAGIPAPWAGFDALPSGASIPFKTTIGAGEIVSMSGNLGATTFQCNGTAGNPGFLVGNATFSGVVTIRGQYCNVIGGNFYGSDGALRVPGNFITVRGATIRDNDTGNGAAIASSSSYVVFMENAVGPTVPLSSWRGADHHCSKQSGDHVWYIRNTFSGCLGDGIQIGDQNNAASAINHIYIVDNVFDGNNQTGAWVKNATDVIFAYNTSINHTSGGDSVPACMGGQYDHAYVWFIGNTCRNNGQGIKWASVSNSGGPGRYAIGNDVETTNSNPSGDGYQPGHGIVSWSSSRVDVYNNRTVSIANVSGRPFVTCGNIGLAGQALDSACGSLDSARTIYQSRYGVAAPF